MKTSPFLFAVAFLGLLSSAAMSAVVVNADFSRDISGSNPNPGGNPAPVLYTSTGPAPDTGTTWNDLQVPLTGAGSSVPAGHVFSTLNASDGSSTGVSITLTGGFYRSFNSGSAAPGTVAALQNDRVFSRNGDIATLTITGLNTTDTHDIYLIGSGDFNTNFTIGATTKNVDGGSHDGDWTLGDEYTSFTGLTTGTGSIVITIQDGIAPINTFGVISGLQIVSVPEPSSTTLLGLGGLGVLLRRRR